MLHLHLRIMKKVLPFVMLSTLAFMSFGKGFISAGQKEVSGKIIGSGDEGISNAYVYVVAGEEETLSIKDGKFSLKTWQPLPLVLVIEHADFEKQRLVIRNAGKPLTIKLVQKSQ